MVVFWKQGTGKLDHDPVTQDGVSYQYRDHENKTPWVTGSVLTDGGGGGQVVKVVWRQS